MTAAVRELHPRIVLDFDTMSNQLAESLRQERMLALLSAAFGTLALGLAVLGLYGVMAYSVARRRNEIGVRIALGADRRRVIGMVLREVAIMVTIGIAIGGAASLGAGRAVGSFLYRISPTDPRVIAGTALLFAAVALAAGLVPAWRAARVDPMEALRQD